MKTNCIIFQNLKTHTLPSLVADTCNASIQEAEVWGSPRVQGQPEPGAGDPVLRTTDTRRPETPDDLELHAVRDSYELPGMGAGD